MGDIPNIPTGTGTGGGDLDDVFDKSLGDFDGGINGEREVIASTGGGAAKGAGAREQSDAGAVGDGAGMSSDGSMSGSGSMGGGSAESGAAGSTASSGSSAGEGGEGSYSGNEQREGGEFENEGKTVELPDDIPIDGSGDDVVGRQIREAAISMQDIDPKAAEALWDEYRKHTGIR